MADYNRNDRRGERFNQQDWNDENNYSNERSWEDRGSRSGRDSENRQGNRWDRDMNRNQGQQSNEWGSNSGFGGDRNFGYGGREFGSNYGGGMYEGNRGYQGQSSFGQGGNSFGSSRGLYDRDYEGMGRNMGSGSGMGGSNYGFEGSGSGRNYGGYSGSNYGGNFGSSGFGQQRHEGDRNWWDKTKDEVSSWFGDDEAERRRNRDERNSHRGKGPRNYNRSDDRIKEDINDRLSDDPMIDASDIEVTVNSGEVTLTGTVDGRNEKRRAEDLAEAISGVRHVENRLRVGKRETTGTNYAAGYATGITDLSGTESNRSDLIGNAGTGTTSSNPSAGSEKRSKAGVS